MHQLRNRHQRPGIFSTCPPASISVTLPNGTTTGTVTQGVPQNLTTAVTDTAGHTISGLALTYESTNPIDITAASSTGAHFGQLSGRGFGYGALPAQQLQSVANQRDWIIWHRTADIFESSEHHGSRHSQRLCLVCGSRNVRVLRSHRAADGHAGLDGAAALRAELDGDGSAGLRISISARRAN